MNKMAGAKQARGLVLVADDSFPIRLALETLFSGWGYDVTLVADGGVAIKKIGGPGRLPFDIVVTDFDIPNADGLEVLAAVKERNKSTKVILMSGSEEIDEVKALAAGANAFLQKPFKIEEMKTLVQKVLGS